MNGSLLPESPSPAVPKYLELCRQIEERIAGGELGPGDRLPSFVRMRRDYGATAATVERVLRTLESKGLVHREANRGVFVSARASTGAGGALGILTQSALRDHPYHATLLQGALDRAHQLGEEVLLLADRSIVHRDRVQGLICMGAALNALQQIPRGMPQVQVMGGEPGVPSVRVDDGQGTAAAIDHLYALGHRRVAFLTLGTMPWQVAGIPNTDFASLQRYHSYLTALKAHGIEPDPRWVKALRDDNGPFRGFNVIGRQKMHEWLLSGWADLGCTALLTQNDEVAVQAIQVLQEAGYDVPRQVSVIGFDNTAYCTWLRPYLTTVDARLADVGAASVDMLLAQCAAPAIALAATETTLTLPTSLVVRESTAAPPVSSPPATGRSGSRTAPQHI